MNYKPFSIDKETLKQIYEVDDCSIEQIFRVATGIDLLQKTIDEVTPGEIEEFVDYQKTIQIVNQFLGLIPVQPDDFDIKVCVINTLKVNAEKKYKAAQVAHCTIQKIERQMPIYHLKIYFTKAYYLKKRFISNQALNRIYLTEQQRCLLKNTSDILVRTV